MSNQPIVKISFEKEADAQLKQMILDEIKSMTTFRHDLVVVEEGGQFIINARKNQLYFYTAEKAATIFEAVDIVKGKEKAHVQKFVKNIHHVLQWNFVLDLEKDTKKLLPKNTLSIELTTAERGQEERKFNVAEAIKDGIVLRYSNIGGKMYMPRFKLSVSNNAKEDVTISVLFLAYDFLITNQLCAKQDIGKGSSHQILYKTKKGERAEIPVSINKKDIQNKGIREVKDFIKIIVTKKGFLDTNGLNQDGIDIPAKNIIGDITEEGWITYTIPLTIIYPSNQEVLIPEEKKNLNLDTCTVMSHNALQGKIQLKTVSDITEKSVNNGAHLAWNSMETQGGVLSKSTSGTSSTDILEISEIRDRNAVNKDNPLVLDFEGKVGENEAIYPFGFDEETGLWYPVGKSEGSKTIIEKLPTSDESPFVPVWEKGILFDSVKIYLKKITGIVDYPLFQYVDIGKDKDTMEFKMIDTEINQLATAKNVILFVHGIMGNNYDKPQMIHMAEELIKDFKWNKKDSIVLAFDYESLNTSVEQTSEDLLSRLEEIGFPIKTEKSNQVLIAHSMGGLVSRFLLEQKGGNQYFNHFIQVGTPNNGSPLATIFQGMEYGVTFALNYFVPKQFSFPLSFLMKAWGQINNTAHELVTGSKTVKKLNSKGKDPKMPYHIVLGDISYDGDEASLKKLKGVEEAIAQQNKVMKLMAKVQKGGIDALLSKKSDGIVPIESMRAVLAVAAKDKWKIQPKAYSTYSHHFHYFNTEPGVIKIAGVIKETMK